VIKLTNAGFEIRGASVEIAREKMKVIEPSMIRSSESHAANPCTHVVLATGEEYFVQESPQEIVEMIFAEAQCQTQPE
jgi:hypothetical protein